MLVLGLGLGLDSVGRGLDAIHAIQYTPASINKARIRYCQMEFVPLGHLFERILAVPPSSAPVETLRVFSNSGLIVRPHRGVRKCQTSCSSHCVCQVFHLQLTVVMGSVHDVANFYSSCATFLT